jgi:hypothetical protein
MISEQVKNFRLAWPAVWQARPAALFLIELLRLSTKKKQNFSRLGGTPELNTQL